jgi:hypothetical protein
LEGARRDIRTLDREIQAIQQGREERNSACPSVWASSSNSAPSRQRRNKKKKEVHASSGLCAIESFILPPILSTIATRLDDASVSDEHSTARAAPTRTSWSRPVRQIRALFFFFLFFFIK